MKKTISSIIFLFLSLLIFVGCKGDSLEIHSMQGQIALTTNVSDDFKVLESNTESYLSTNIDIVINFETFNLNDDTKSVLVINEHEISLDQFSGEKNMYKSNSLTVLGANVKEGKLVFSIRTGFDEYQMVDRFSIKNVYITIKDQNIWSNEYSEENYYNSSLNIGPSSLTSDYRFSYLDSRTFTFNIPEKYLNSQAVLCTENLEKYTLLVNDEQRVIENDAYLDISINIENNEIITDDKELVLTKSKSVSTYIISMDGLEIKEGFRLSKDSWSPGNHTIEIYACNDKGFIVKKIISFKLADVSIIKTDLLYKTYDIGAQTSLSNDISNLGVLVDNGTYQTVFSKVPSLTFEINESEETRIMWEGNIPLNRTAFMQVYNPNNKCFEVVSTAVCNSENDKILLGFERTNSKEYVIDGKIYVRVGNINLNETKEITANIYHVSDLQYISQKASKDEGGYIQKEAAQALKSIKDYLIENKENSYTLMTGDFVQTKSNAVLEWEAVMKYLINPILEAEVAFGVSSGNHDVGGLKENSVNGSNALDEELYYNYFNDNLGSNKFDKFDYYQEGFEDNRSHWDKLTLNGHEFIFLYLGWGSSQTGIYVSDKDIQFAKKVLEQNYNTDVILATHCYMGPTNSRNNTGNYVFDELVKPYKNIKMVLSGHVNGTSMSIDLIDDDNNGTYDRQVLQLLTDFQEEDNTYGASYIRNIGLDFSNNQMIFTLYSPFFNDTEIEVLQNPNIVKDNLCFTYDYDLTNIGYGMKSYGLK